MWGTMSYLLLNKIESFLPEKISQEVDISVPPILLHSDINDENILGNFREESEEVESPSKVATSPNWDPVGIIDFGIFVVKFR